MIRATGFFVFAVLLAIGCGGGGDNQQQPTTRTAVGQFKDANVAGLSYASGGQSGITDSEGRFTYEVGEPVTFSLGGVALGGAEGKSVVTPIDLIERGSSSSGPVLNIVQFLMSLDEDGDLSNGISIPEEVRRLAQGWAFVQVFSDSSDFEQQLERTRSELRERFSAYGSAEIPGRAHAKSHLESTFRCSYSGAYFGTYQGTDRGNFGILIDANSGTVSGVAYSTEHDEYLTLTGTRSVSYDQNAAFASGNTNQGTEFDGRFTSVDTVEGQWSYRPDPSIGGRFSGQRIGGKQYATYRATGAWRTNGGFDHGVFTFDVDDSGRVTGFAYNIANDTSGSVNGSLSGTVISATTDEGIRIEGTLDRNAGVVRGRFDAPTGESGTFEGSGCQLN